MDRGWTWRIYAPAPEGAPSNRARIISEGRITCLDAYDALKNGLAQFAELSQFVGKDLNGVYIQAVRK